MVELVASDYRLTIAPGCGGSVARFDWRGMPLFRPACGAGVLDSGCFPLVPFSNRIADGRFRFGGQDISLAPNMPDSDHPHPLHGFGWLAAWSVAQQGVTSATLIHDHAGGEWPWPYRAEQAFRLSGEGLIIELRLTNLAASPMPAGLGLHPYFPCDDATRYLGLHRGEWRNSADCLPLALDERDMAIDWWDGAPVSSRNVDTAYAGRSGDLAIAWPSRGLGLTIHPDATLPHTVVYSPPGADFFCVEPVSHFTDAHNSPRTDHGLVALAPGATMAVACRFTVHTLGD